MKAVIYKRVSVLKNSVDGTSLDVQQERLEAYAKAQGWEVVEVYEDAGISAKDTNRPDLQRMLKDAEKGKFDVILVYKLDRLSRSVSDFHQLTNFLDQHKVALVSVTQHLDTSSPTGRLLRNILVDFANFERELITERILDSKTHRAMEGKWNGGHAPYGYKLVNKKPQIVPEEAEKVKKVYELYLTSQKSMRQIARETGISFSQVELILMNPIYAGKLAWGKTKNKDHKGMFRRLKIEDWIMVDGGHEAIITFDDWLRVQEIKKAKNRIPGDRNDNQLFKNLCFCGNCGRKLHFFVNQKPYSYYRCHDVNRFEGCKGISVRQEELEEKVVRKINDLLSDTEFWHQVQQNIEESIKDRQKEKRLLQTQKQLSQVEERIRRLVDQMADSDIAHLIKPKLLKLEAERKELQREIAAAETEHEEQNENPQFANELMNDLISNWKQLTHGEKAEGIHLLVKALICYNDRVQIEWTDKALPKTEFRLHRRYRNGLIAELCY